MVVNIRNFLHIILLTIVTSGLYCQSFTARVSSNKIGLNQTFKIDFVIEGQASNFTPPSFTPFQVVSGPSVSHSYQNVNGRVSRSMTYSYFLQPTKTGSFQIGSASTNIGGKTYSTKPLGIQVVKGSTSQGQPTSRQPQSSGKLQPTKNKTSSQNIKDHFFLKAYTNKSRPYQGEQIIVSFKIFVNVNLVNYGVSDQPKMDGFWVHKVDQPQSPRVTVENINGEQYRTATIYKAILFPQKSGNLKIAPMEVEAIVRVVQQRQSFYNPFGGYQDVKVKLKSNPLTIKVKPYPPNPPSLFDGITGSYSMDVTTDKTETKANEPITLKIKIKGRGNLKLIPAFDLDLPADIETYEPKIKENISNSGGVISGSKTFEYLLIPRSQGTYKLPPLSLSYFDPIDNRYESLSSKEIIINVGKGTSDEYVGPTVVSKKSIELRGKDIQFIKLDPDFIEMGFEHFFGSGLYLILLVSPFLILVFILIYKRQITKSHNNVALMKMKKATSVAKKHLKTAKKYLREKKNQEFYLAITNAFNRYVCDKMQIEAADLSKDKIKQELLLRNVKDANINNLVELLDNCDFARYAPSQSNQELDSVYQESILLLSAIEKEIKK